jgi:hypothetical protein
MDKVEPGTLKEKKKRRSRASLKGFASLRKGRRVPLVAQAVLDKYIPKPSNEDIDMLWEGVNSQHVWEKTPGVYAQAVGIYMYNRSKAGKAANSIKPARAE